MKILITGSKGFIGKNLTNFIQDNYNHEVLEFNRGQSLKSLAIMIKESRFHNSSCRCKQTKRKRTF